MTKLEEISRLLQAGQASRVKSAVLEALRDGVPPRTILDDGLLVGIDIIAEQFRTAEVFVPQVLTASRAIHAGLQELRPYLIDDSIAPIGTVVIGTVRGDMHDIGKTIVKLMMEAHGLSVHDLGVDVSPEEFYEAAVGHKADIVCLSALLTSTMDEMSSVIACFVRHGVRDKFKIMIGGAPISKRFSDHICADIYMGDAVEAARAASDYCRSLQHQQD